MARKVLVSILIIIMLFSLTACSNSTSAVFIQNMSSESEEISSEIADENFYISYKNVIDLKRVSRTDMSILYFDELTYSISVYDSNAAVLWNSLPLEYIGEACAALSVDIIVKGNEYTLNSQTDSVAKGNANYEIIDNTIKVNYNFQTTISDIEIDFTVPVEFVAEDGKLTVKLDCSALYDNLDISEVIIEKIDLLSYFGSNTEENEGDYIVIPDGSGAIIDTSEKAEEFSVISTKVYSNDYSLSEEENQSSAIISSFGMKTDNAAFVALIEDGEEIATINASKALESGSYNRVWASFEITSVAINEDENCIYYSTAPYDGTIQMSYRFLANDNAHYIAMANATKEMLIRNSSLTTSTIEESSSLPVNISLIGSAITVDDFGKNETQTLTNFEQASLIISFLKSKDFNNLNIEYEGVLQGSTSQENIQTASLMTKLGSESEFETLLSEISAQQGISLYLGVNLISSSNFDENAVNFFDEYILIGASTLNYQENAVSYLKLASPSELSDNTNELLALLQSYDISAVSLNDVGSVLYSDNSEEKVYSLSETMSEIQTQVQAISATQNLMIDTGNLYAIKYADVITNLAETSSVDDLQYCTSIPYIQIILHGSVIYSSSAVNLDDDLAYAMLKDIEYGSVPSLEIYYENLEDDYYYMNNISQFQSYYVLANSVLSGLMSATITDHYQVQSGVYCTEYDNTSLVLVNYNEETVSVFGVEIQPLSAVRVN